MKLWKRLKHISKTIRFKAFMILAVFAIVYIFIFSFFFIYAVKSMKDKVIDSYDSMLSLHVNQLKSQIMDTNHFLDNLSNHFDMNMMAIESPETDEYVLTRFRVYNDIRTNYSLSSIMDSVYVYDNRSDSFLTIPDDKGRYQNLGRKLLEEQEDKRGKWRLMEENGTYTLAKKNKVSESLWVMAFIRVEEIARELKSIGAKDGFFWDIATIDGKIVAANYKEKEQEKGPVEEYFSRHSTVENSYEGLGLNFRIYISNDSIWSQNIFFVLFFPTSALIVFFILWAVFCGLRRRILEPLDQLIVGMQEFAGGNENVEISIGGTVEYELVFTMKIFNDMVYQIKNNRFLIYEEKLEKQKLLIQNLQSQIDPHFFSNTLNLIYNLTATKRNDIAQKCLLLLSAYYRYMTRIGQQQIALEKEIDFTDNYLEIMKLRFPGKIQAEITTAEELCRLQVPPMLIQPLTENSIKHGFVDRNHTFELKVYAVQEGDCAVICIEDSGCGFPEEYRGVFDQGRALPTKDDQESENHVGLQNVFQRLLIFYGEDANMEIGWTGSKTEVKIVIHNVERYLC